MPTAKPTASGPIGAGSIPSGGPGAGTRRSKGEDVDARRSGEPPKVGTKDSHMTPGTIAGQNANGGYSKINTRPTGQPGKNGADLPSVGSRGGPLVAGDGD